MPYQNELTDKEFYRGVAKLIGVKASTVQKYWEMGFNEFIVRELFFKGSCRIPNLGSFHLRKVEERTQIQTDANGRTAIYQVPERYVPVFTAHDTMINDVNMQGVTKKYRKRLRAGVLTERDYMRQLRAEACNANGKITEEQVNQAKEDFKEFLAEKKKVKGDVERVDGDKKRQRIVH